MIGVLPVDKPVGPTSHDVVAMARRALGTRRIGHTGTLDPFASGLLLLCIDRATRLAEYLTGLDKTYEAVARLGEATDTLDRTGTVVSSSEEWKYLDEDRVRRAFRSLRGRQLQTPPAYSAKKIGGRRAYEVAREGGEVVPEPVEVEVHELDLAAIDGRDVTFRTRCSSGTYIRALARDAGEALGVGAHLVELRRTAIGGFGLAGAVAVEQLEDEAAVAAALLSPLAAMDHLPALQLDADQVERVRHGQRLEVQEIPGTPLVLTAHGELVAVAEREGDMVRPRKVFV